MNGGSSSRPRARFGPSWPTVIGGTRLPQRRIIRLTALTAACGWPRRRNQRGLSGMAKCTSKGTTPSARPPGNAISRKPCGLSVSRKATNGSTVKALASMTSIDRAIGAPVLRRHQLGGNRERRRDGKSHADAGDEADGDQLLGGLRQRDQQREEGADDDADLHDELAAEPVGQRRGSEASDHDQEGRAGDEPANILAGQARAALWPARSTIRRGPGHSLRRSRPCPGPRSTAGGRR